MPQEKRPLTTSPSQQDDYAALFIERFGEAAWAQERARDAEEAARCTPAARSRPSSTTRSPSRTARTTSPA